MRQIRFWYAALLVWFFLLFNVERLHGPINLASLVYAVAPALALCVVVMPRLHEASLIVLALLVAAIIVPAKVYLGYPIGGPYLPITIVEVGAIAITGLLAGRIRRGFDEFVEAVAATITSHLCDHSQTFADGQADMWREIRRARLHNRPLALLAVRPARPIPEVTRERLAREIEQAMTTRYFISRIAELLSAETRDSDVIALRDGHFLVLLPEATRERAEELICRFTKLASTELGIDLEIGASVFPDEEITFVRLVDRAESQMRGQLLVDEALNGDHPRVRSFKRRGERREGAVEAIDQQSIEQSQTQNGKVPRAGAAK